MDPQLTFLTDQVEKRLFGAIAKEVSGFPTLAAEWSCNDGYGIVACVRGTEGRNGNGNELPVGYVRLVWLIASIKEERGWLQVWDNWMHASVRNPEEVELHMLRMLTTTHREHNILAAPESLPHASGVYALLRRVRFGTLPEVVRKSALELCVLPYAEDATFFVTPETAERLSADR